MWELTVVFLSLGPAIGRYPIKFILPEVPRLNTFVFKKSSEKNIFTIIFVVKSLRGFGWNNVGPASQRVAHNYFTIGPMYHVIRVVSFREI